MLPAWVKAALSANDRLKVYLTVRQTASSHAAQPKRELPDLVTAMAAAGLSDAWLQEVAAGATRIEADLHVHDMPRLVKCFAEDLDTMARPVLETAAAEAEPRHRVQHWLSWLGTLPADRLSGKQIEAFIPGRRDGPDSLHLLVMDLHRQINRLSGELASEVIHGANVWELQPEDRIRVSAFMRGLHRTAALKFVHPGLDTCATRDGERLLLQDDIGTNGAHVLVIQINARRITPTYSDLHRSRLEFFQALLTPFGAPWSGLESRTSAELNQGEPHSVATAEFDCPDDRSLDAALEGIASRIVLLIDWNDPRKRLQAFVEKRDAIAVLAEAARIELGHTGRLDFPVHKNSHFLVQKSCTFCVLKNTAGLLDLQ